MIDTHDQDLEMCAELLEAVASSLGDASDPLSQAEVFESTVYQSKALLLDVTQNVRDGIRLGELDATTGARQVALLEDILQPLMQGKLQRPDELGLLYLRMARVFRELAKAPLRQRSSDDEPTISDKRRNGA